MAHEPDAVGDVPIAVVGIGLEGAEGLTPTARQVVEQANVLVGSDRHLTYFPDHPAEKIGLGSMQAAIAQIQACLASQSTPPSPASIVVLASGDPLFFGIGRLLLQHFTPHQLAFYPHLSSMQLAFSRIKQPWHDACLLSVHGRSPDRLIQALQRGEATIALLTDDIQTPHAIARLIQDLALPSRYRLWVCENLGDAAEKVRSFLPEAMPTDPFAPLTVVILTREAEASAVLSDTTLATLPTFGIADSLFLSFSDRPGLMTKREVRVLALGELSLREDPVIWDIGAGTGSVSVEMARLCPRSTILAIEKSAAGIALIKQNSHRFQCPNITPCYGQAPDILADLPAPDRVFVGGSGGHLLPILDQVAQVLSPKGIIVVAIATLDHLSGIMQWLDAPTQRYRWQGHTLQAQLARSVAIASLTRLHPLNPVFLIRLHRSTPDTAALE
ncbi:MAG: precorrin-6y C5,15-methyltransferase (decarboxylating) subunit CbiE [Cyanobacteria bacterium J06638_22]